jgi:hypothetical protein
MPRVQVQMLEDADAVVKAADLLRQSADAMQDRRQQAFDSGAITAPQARKNVLEENDLRIHISEMLLRAIKLVVDGAGPSQSDLEGAIEKANEEIRKIEQVRQALRIFASVLNLATAILGRDPVSILDALSAVKKHSGAV